jgi:NAD(P)H-hydrate repair Nnr-like enzyme with NAD(P)H-hydrate epimerase domain
MIPDPIEPLPSIGAELASSLAATVVPDPAARALLSGWHLADAIRRLFWEDDPAGRRVVLVTGPGEDARTVAAAARWLMGWSAEPLILQSVDRIAEAEAHDPELVVDALGGWLGPLLGEERGLAEWIDDAPAPVLSLHLPAGLDPETGEPGAEVVHATATLVLGLPTHVALDPEAAAYVGDVYAADIGMSPETATALGVQTPSAGWFASSGLLAVRRSGSP